MNVTKIDFLSLDVKGFEMPILCSLPWDKLDISVIAVEYSHGKKPDYKEFMTSQGYRMQKDIHYYNEKLVLYVDDFIFVKKQCSNICSNLQMQKRLNPLSKCHLFV